MYFADQIFGTEIRKNSQKKSQKIEKIAFKCDKLCPNDMKVEQILYNDGFYQLQAFLHFFLSGQ